MQFVLPTTTNHNGVILDWADYVLIATGVITIALLGLLLLHIFKIQFLKNRSEVTKMDGFDFIERIRKNGDNTPALMLTARGEKSDVTRGLTLGADDYVTKPFSLLELEARVRSNRVGEQHHALHRVLQPKHQFERD